MQHLDFNSIKVRLERLNIRFCLSPKWNFNSIKVRLEPFFAERVFDSVVYFNSIKVRLEQSSLRDATLVVALFQFHKGTIRTLCGCAHQSDFAPFQFHKGTIRTRRGVAPRLPVCRNFNSIKVRLERYSVTGCYWLQRFQFHKGTIRTPHPVPLAMLLRYFNSIKVRLEP